MPNNIPSNNCLARNIQVLQVYFLQDLQDLALNLAQILQEKYLQDLNISCKMYGFYWDSYVAMSLLINTLEQAVPFVVLFLCVKTFPLINRSCVINNKTSETPNPFL